MTSAPGRLLVTGAAGFVGAAVCRYAVQQGWKVVGAVRRDPHRVTGADAVIADVVTDDLLPLLRSHAPDVIVHAAGPASVADSFSDPAADFRACVLGWHNVLESVRRYRQPVSVVQVSSAAVYGQPSTLPVPESAVLDPLSPYGYHKVVCERLSAEYSRCFGVPTVSARVFSLIGPSQRRLLTWELARQALGSSPEVRVRGTGLETRDFLLMGDAAAALVSLGALATRPAPGVPAEALVVNVAGGIETSVAELAHQIVRLSGCGKPVVFEGRGSTGDPPRWSADVTRLRTLLPDWSPRSLADGLAHCLDHWTVAVR